MTFDRLCSLLLLGVLVWIVAERPGLPVRPAGVGTSCSCPHCQPRPDPQPLPKPRRPGAIGDGN